MFVEMEFDVRGTVCGDIKNVNPDKCTISRHFLVLPLSRVYFSLKYDDGEAMNVAGAGVCKFQPLRPDESWNC